MKTSKHIKNKGFALISTLSIMSLLVMLAIGMMSLATTESKVANATKYEMEAKANARMALMIALGELQVAMGPDQRISATSNILDTSPESDSVEGVASQNVLGVWDSWNTYITDPLDSSHPSAPGMTIQQSYVDGRAPLFKKWLVSHDHTQELEQWDVVRNGFKFSEEALMVGEGSLGSEVDEETYVQAGKILTTDASGNETGAYAWWVGGENVKADLGVATDREPSESGDGLAAIQTANSAAELLDPSESEGFEEFTEDAADRAKMISAGQISLEASDRDSARARFFDYTSGNRAVLADVRRGGTKHDLNLLFENDTFPEEFRAASSPPWNRNLTVDPTIRELDGEVASKGEAMTNPHTTLPSWNKMRSYYRLYRDTPEADAGVKWEGTGDSAFPYTQARMLTKLLGAVDPGDGKKALYPDHGGYSRLPLIVRYMFLLGLNREEGTRRVRRKDTAVVNFNCVLVPVVVLWNPYNVELRYRSEDFHIDIANSYIVRLSHKLSSKPDGKENDATWKAISPPNDALESFQKMRVKDEKGEPAGAEISLDPGELVMLSVQRDSGSAGSSDKENQGVENAARGLLDNLDDPLLGATRQLAWYTTEDVNSSGTKGPEIRIAIGRSGNAQTMDRLGAAPNAFALTLKYPRESAEEIFSDDEGNEIDIGTISSVEASGIVCNWSDIATEGNTDGFVNQIVVEPQRWPDRDGVTEFIGIIQVVAKSAEQVADGTYPTGDTNNGVDFRNKTWLHAAPIHPVHMNNLANPIAKANFPYVMHYQSVGGNPELGALLGEGGGGVTYMGGGYSPSTGVAQMSMLELPTAPITSLNGFATMRLRPSTIQTFDTSNSDYADGFYNPQWKAAGFHSASFALGIGNGYAHPMVPESGIIQSFNGADWIDRNNNANTGKIDAVDNSLEDVVATDYWDQLLLTNDALYDNWFCSAVVPEIRAGNETKGISAVFSDFLRGIGRLTNSRYKLYLPEGMTADDVENEIIPGGGLDDEAYKKIGSFMMVDGAFNVNSTSVDAWKALLHGLKKRHQIAYGADAQTINVEGGSDSELVLSRFGWAPTNKEADTAFGDQAAWKGIRKLTEKQIDKLAAEIVHQVKRRGPFLNMSEFINRRIGDSNDSRLNQAGALQAAIDWDEFSNGYNGSGSTGDESINGIFKNGSEDMLKDVTVEYPNPTAAKGSRHSGIPGYIMASDVLRAIGDTIVVRDDTFTIRAYGESKDAQGNVKAKAWCEAKVQRYPEYVEHKSGSSSSGGNSPWEQSHDKLGSDVRSVLTEENKTYGRKMRVVSFRWLSPSEV